MNVRATQITASFEPVTFRTFAFLGQSACLVAQVPEGACFEQLQLVGGLHLRARVVLDGVDVAVGLHVRGQILAVFGTNRPRTWSAVFSEFDRSRLKASPMAWL